jgi:translocation and assembly module TamA
VFVESRWEGLPGTLKSVLREHGYAEAQVNGEARVDLGTHKAMLKLSVIPGPRYKFGEVTAAQVGQGRVEPWRIEEQAREGLEGENYFSESGLKEVEQRIRGMGVFGAAEVSTGPGNPETGTIPIKIHVQEAPFHAIRGGFGIGIEQARNDIHLVGEYTHRDFLGGLRRLNLKASAGYAFLPNAYSVVGGGDRVTKHGPIALLSSELIQPRLFHPNVSGLSRLELERELQPAFSDYGARMKLGVTWQPWTWLAFTPSYNLELYVLDAGTAQLGGGSPALLFGCPGLCALSYLEERVEVDRRDNKQDPRSGYLLGLSLQQGGGALGGSFQYLRVLPEARGYVSFLEKQRLTFSLKIRLGTLIPLDRDPLSSPIVARFFSGGDFMRGFSSRRLAPMALVQKTNLTTATRYSAEAYPIGGNGMMENQLEARYSLTDNLRVATFFDTGFVTSERLNLKDASYFTRNLLAAVGGGLRYLTPVGPIRLDFAYRLNLGPTLPVYPVPGKSLTYDPNPGCFGIGAGSPTHGGAPEGPCALHLSIGEAF